MSDKFWISQIDCAEQLVLQQLLALEKTQNFGIRIHDATPAQYQRETTFWTKEVEGKTLMSSNRQNSCPGFLGWLSKQLQVSVQTVDWNDQIGFVHYSKFDQGEAPVYFTYWQNEFLEHRGIDYNRIISDGRRDATERTVLNYFTCPEHEPYYVFDQLTKNFDFWDLSEQLAGEDFEFNDCTAIEMAMEPLNLSEMGSLDQHNKLLPWNTVSQYSQQLSLASR